MDNLDGCIVLTTASSEAEAEAIASGLVSDRLAACVNIYPIKSVYRWEGAVQREEEWQLVIKTRSNYYAEVAAKIESLHSYDVPEIIVIPIEQGSSAYLKWLKAQVQPSRPEPPERFV